MDKIKKIPIIGYLIRLLVALVKLPKHVDEIYLLQNKENMFKERVNAFEERENAFEERVNAFEERMKEHALEFEQSIQEQEAIFQRDKNCLKQEIELIMEHKEIQQKGIEEIQQWNTKQQEEIDSASMQIRVLSERTEKQEESVRRLKELQVEDSYFERLNLLLSIHPTLWGNKDKLHISELAAMGACFFNTNSGHITVGDYSFAGSNVSVLAGSHDMQLNGLLRRDVEIKEGCDIVIGKGVWLASDCTILGPATIGDNSVIAAGAVVTPGTVVPPNSIYGGVPAKYMGEIKIDDWQDPKKPAILRALERNDGVLFVDGWTEKHGSWFQNRVFMGHTLVREDAVIYSQKGKLRLFCQTEGTSTGIICCCIDDKESKAFEIIQPVDILEIDINDGYEEKDVHTITIHTEDCKKLFVSVLKCDEQLSTQ